MSGNLKMWFSFLKRFVASSDAALTNNLADVYASKTASMSRNDKIMAHIQGIYKTEDVKIKNDVSNEWKFYS